MKKSIQDYADLDVEDIVKHALRLKSPVHIIVSDERGHGKEYAVELVEIPTFWLTCFKKKKEAIAYCAGHQLKISPSKKG